MEAEGRLRHAQLHSDVRALEELVSPDLIFTSHWGQLVRKEDELAFHRSGVLRLEKAVPSEEHIQVYDGFAVISVLMHLVGSYEGAPIDEHIRYTRIWASTPGGAIQLVAGHSSAVQQG
jgi:hypothetical protein